MVSHEVRVLREVDGLQRQPPEPLPAVDGLVLRGTNVISEGSVKGRSIGGDLVGGTDDLFERLRWVGIGVACVGLTCADATPAPPILLPCSRASMNDMLGDCFYRQPSVQTRHSFHSAVGKCEKTICRGGEFFREKKSGDFFPRALFSLDGESGFALVRISTNQNAVGR